MTVNSWLLAIISSILITTTIMLLGTYQSIMAQQQLIANYQQALTQNSTPALAQNYTQVTQAYNHRLQQFPNSLIAKICHFSTKNPDPPVNH